MATPQAKNHRLASDVFDIIADEVGVSRSELTDGRDFVDLGIDDLLARSIISRIMDTLELYLPQTAFRDHPTAADLQNFIESFTNQEIKPSKSLGTGANVTFTPSARISTNAVAPLSIPLQGKATSARKIIFLLPDGSGSGMAYARLPSISPDVCLVGMNTPFLGGNGNFTGRIEDLAPLWVNEIRQRQPLGPYILGGWSAGGYYSFEVAKQLTREGERVQKLILIDSPCRLVFEPLPMEVIHFLAAKNLLGSWGPKKTPDWFIKHFAATIDAVTKYMPTSMEPDEHVPQVYIIWASDGVVQKIDDAETGLDLNVKVTRFLLESRRDFGLHGWDKLFPGATVSIAQMPGNHFTLIHPPDVSGPLLNL